jgi:hypothetical protein
MRASDLLGDADALVADPATSGRCLRSMGLLREGQEETMRASRYRLPKSAISAFAGVFCLALPACSLFGPDDPRAGLSCLDDSKECVDRRRVTLDSYLADNDRKWIKEPATAQAHVSGVRLFAFRSRKKELSCEELARGRREADSVAKSLHGPEGKEFPPALIARATLFASEVSKELTAEMRARRCKV